jgi:hypothetical protein
MNGFRASKRSPPRSSGRGSPLYEVKLTEVAMGKQYDIYDIERTIRILPDYNYVKCAIWDYGYYRIHPANELPALLKKLKADTYDFTTPHYRHRPFNLKTDRLRDFILTWEQPIAINSRW